MKEIHDQGICRAESAAQNNSYNKINGDCERIDHIHLVVLFRTEILCDNNACCSCDHVKENVHHEHDRIGISDSSDRILVIMAQHHGVHIVDHRVKEKLKEHRPRKNKQRSLLVYNDSVFPVQRVCHRVPLSPFLSSDV